MQTSGPSLPRPSTWEEQEQRASRGREGGTAEDVNLTVIRVTKDEHFRKSAGLEVHVLK